ncbi:MAG: protein-L-isoaspartate(D-aspartate) O-methyltransferase [Betaproteobacteria bacterium]
MNLTGSGNTGIGMTGPRTRARMVERVREQGVRDEIVLEAMLAVPRHVFVEEALASRAYEDTPLPIGYGQTISQPYIVARMTELARSGRRLGNVLEIGTGCGYQTAVLAHVADAVYSVERIAPLAAKARQTLQRLRQANVRIKHADGGALTEVDLMFDAIVVTAAAKYVPEEWTRQLNVGGRLVLPLTAGGDQQTLTMITRTETGSRQEQFEAVRFVPLLPGLSG